MDGTSQRQARLPRLRLPAVTPSLAIELDVAKPVRGKPRRPKAVVHSGAMLVAAMITEACPPKPPPVPTATTQLRFSSDLAKDPHLVGSLTPTTRRLPLGTTDGATRTFSWSCAPARSVVGDQV